VASTLLALVAWSLEEDVTPAPGKMQELFRSLVGPGLGAGFALGIRTPSPPSSPPAPGGLASQGSPAPAARSDVSRNPASAPEGEGGRR